MNNILIVDDEYISRNKIHFLLDYVQYGFNIVGEAENGKEALAFIEKNNVDIVFTDVYMPEMDGIELAEYIHKYYPQISVVILSNYSEFDQVKRAFFSNITDYLLKQTLTKEIMIALLNKLKARHISNNNDVILKKAQNEFNYQSTVISAILHGSKDFLPQNSLIAILRIKNMEIHTQFYTGEEIQILFQNIINIIAQICKDDIKDFVIFKNDDNIIIYLPFNQEISEIEIMNIISKHIKQINYSVYKFFNFHLLWGISGLSTESYTVDQCLNEAKQMLKNAPSSNKNFSSEFEVITNTIPATQEKKLVTALSQLDEASVNACLEEIFKTINPKYSLDSLVNKLIFIATNFSSNFDVSAHNISHLNKNYSPKECLEWSKNIFKLIITNYKNSPEHSNSEKYVQLAIEYISENYKKDISRRDIAQHLKINDHYLSRIFNLVTGKTMTTYINEYRIEEAKKLLNQGDVNIKYLYSAVGFNDYNYFFVVFKKYVGLTPIQYRSKYCK